MRQSTKQRRIAERLKLPRFSERNLSSIEQTAKGTSCKRCGVYMINTKRMHCRPCAKAIANIDKQMEEERAAQELDRQLLKEKYW